MSRVGEGRTDLRRGGPVLVALVIGAVAGAVLGSQASGGTPRIVEGWAMPNADGTAISLHDSPEDERGEGYVVAGARWAGVDGRTHPGGDAPTCVGTDTATLTRVQLGLVGVETDEAGQWQHVVWLRCME